MIITITNETKPLTTVITVSQLKEYLRIDHSAEDTSLELLIKGATDLLEQHTRRAFINRTITLTTGIMAQVRLPKTHSPTNVTVTDLDTEEPITGYKLDGNLLTLPYTARVKVIYTAGYGATAADVPDAIRQAVPALCLQHYEQRGETGMSAVQGILNTLTPFRMVRL